MAEVARLFVAVALPDQARAAVTAVMGSLGDAPGIRWARPEVLHITLAFLGNVDRERIPAFREALEGACAGTGAFELVLTGIGSFPKRGNARVLWVGVEDRGRLVALQERIAEALLPLGYEPEDRPFRPHVTIGRAKRKPVAVPEKAVAVGEVARWTVSAIALVESELRPEGPRYAGLAAVELS